ncbi:metal ABC transporter solute-binding protein, Zn/Mn family [Blastococcus sp. SYSU D01042]
MRHATLRAGLTVLAVLAAPACSGDRTPGSQAAVSSGDPAACPGEILDVVVSVGAWGDVVRRLGGDCATVTTIAPTGTAPVGPDADRAAFDAADLVVVNGAGYDGWATELADAAAGRPAVVSAAEAVGSERRGRDPWLWNDPVAVPAVAEAVADELGRLSPDAAPYFGAQHTAWATELQPWLETIGALRVDATGRSFAATGGAFVPTAEAAGLTDRTPGPRTGALPPDEVAAVEELLRGGALDVLVLDGGPDEGVTDRLREAADEADVPVAEVAAAPPDDAPFVEWQLDQLAELAEALGQE